MTTNHDDVLGQATQLMRQHTDAGWTAISANILHRALHAFRPSAPVRGRHDLGDFFIASDVLVSQLRQSIDTIPGAAATHITCTTGDNHQLDAITIQVIAAYGTPLLTLADHVHQLAAHILAQQLGELAPTDQAIHTHVHINNVTNDPHDGL